MKKDLRYVSQFCTALKVLCEELEADLPTPICSCIYHCACITRLSNYKHHHEFTHSIQFLTGLNNSFGLVHSQILLLNLLPNLFFFYDSKILINAADYMKSQGRGCGYGSSLISCNKKVCIHYGRNGHTIDTCYMKHGFPANFDNITAMANISSLDLNEKGRMLIILRVVKEMTHMPSLKINMIN